MFDAIGEGHRIMHEGPKKEIDLDELERLAKAATPGPWTANNWGRVWHTPSPDSKRLVCDTMRNTVRNPKRWRANAKLIAAMREAVPELIARVRELERQRDWLATMLAHTCAQAKDCQLFHNCPAWKYGWTCGKVSKDEWITAAKEAGE